MLFSLSRLLYISVVLISFLSWYQIGGATEATILKNVIKVKTYEVGSDGSYIFRSYGSAIAISPSRILTNAHVITGRDDLPTGHYEVCFSVDFERVPVCRDTARLIAYDTVADLALLELSHTSSLSPFVLSSAKIAIGSYVSMYGYPAIGGETITRTEGKIAGYEQSMYKIDGSIDHGNSGGGAFNNSGELIGMPTAVASDNASIGYMIPIRRIADFLNKRTNNYEIYTEFPDRLFSKFIRRIQSYTSNKATYQWNDVSIRNPRPYGLILKASMISADNRMATWNFVDGYDRLSILFSCTDDAGLVSGWQSRLDGLPGERLVYPTWTMTTTQDADHLIVSSVHKTYAPSMTLYYKGYDACFAEISYPDVKKDAKSLEKAIQFLKKGVTFRSKYILPNRVDTPYFATSVLQKDTRIVQGIDTRGVISTVLGFEISSGVWINETIEHKEYQTREELGTTLDMDFDSIANWTEYLSAIADFGISTSDITTLDLSSGQKAVFVVRHNNEKKSTNVTLQYIYQTQTGAYAYWSWSTTIAGEHIPDLTRLKQFLVSLTYPGTMFIK